MMEKSLKYASWLTEYGFSLIPLNNNPNDPHFRKRPRDSGWRSAKYSHADLQAAFRSTHAIGARVPAHYVVIDVDVKDGKRGLESLALFPQDNLFNGSYLTTGSGGFHIFFKLPDGIEKIDTGVRSLPDIDFRVIGSQVVAAGSINAHGNPYTWDEVTLSTEIVDIPVIPTDIWNFLQPLQRENHLVNNSDHGSPDILYSDAELQVLLDSIDVTQYREHDEWFKVMCAAHEASGGLGFDVFYLWCQSDPDPKHRISHGELKKRWKSFDVSAGAHGGITRKYLEKISAPTAKATADFSIRAEREGIPPIQFRSSHVNNPSGAAKINLGPNLSTMNSINGVVSTIDRQSRAAVDTQTATETDSAVIDSDDTYIIDTENLLTGPFEEMNLRHAVVSVGGQIRFLGHTTNVYGQPSYEFMKSQDFNLLTCNLPKVEVQRGNTIVMVSVAEQWTQWAGRREYFKLDFLPGHIQEEVDKSHPGTLNLWLGWRVQPIEPPAATVAGDRAIPPEECSHFTKLICHLSGRPSALDMDFMPNETRFLFDWLAYSFAFPDRPIGVAIALRGKKGIGKGVLSQFLQWMTGEGTYVVSDMDKVVGRFNAMLRQTMFLFLDEAFWSGSKKAARTLQNILTEPMLSTEEKGLPIVSTRNCLHTLLASNDDWIVPASGEDERRYAVFDSSAGLKTKWSFWAEIRDKYSLNSFDLTKGDTVEMKEKRLGLLLGWLIARGQWLDRNGWIANRNIPETDALEEQKMHSEGPMETWWKESVLGLGELGDLDIEAIISATENSQEPPAKTYEVWVQKVRDQFLNSEPGQLMMKKPSYSTLGISQSLGSFLHKKLISTKKVKKVVPKELRLEIEHSALKYQAYAYVFSLQDLKKLSRGAQSSLP